MKAVYVFMKETQERTLTFSTMPGHSKKIAFYEPGSILSDNEHFGVLILYFLTPRMVRNTLLLFISHEAYNILSQKSKWTWKMG